MPVPAHAPSTGADNPFGSFGHEFESRRSWVSSLAASSTVYVLLGLVAASVTATKTYIERKKPVPVKFVEKVVKPPPPAPPMPKEPPKPVELKPPPPPKLEARQQAPNPAVPKDLKVRKLDTPPPPKELVAPTEMPQTAPAEADPSLDQGIAVYGDGRGDATGLEGGYGSGIAAGIVDNPDVLAQAVSKPDPAYPEDMLVAGRQATVVLKCVVLADGTVHSVEVLEGEEPFTTAAIEAIKKKWKFEPGKLRGRNVNSVQTVTVNFKILVG